MKVTDKWRKRERGCYSLREKKNRCSGWWGDRHMGYKEKEDVIRYERRTLVTMNNIIYFVRQAHMTLL